MRNNANPIPDNRRMSTVGSYNSCNVTSVNNDLGPTKYSELVLLSDTYDCSKSQPVGHPAAGPTPFSGQRLAIDAGGVGSAAWGIVGCKQASACNGYLVGGPANAVHATSLAGYKGYDGAIYQTMLEGAPAFAIPIRSGTYDVQLSFVEPTYNDLSQRRFHFEIERQRLESSFDVYREAHGKNTLVQRTYRMTVGDGTLNINFIKGTQPALISFIRITRA